MKTIPMRRTMGRLAQKLGVRKISSGFDLDNRLKQLYKELQGEFLFLQVGANDGRSNDPIYPFVSTYHPSGLVVEPQPDAFKRLQATYPKADFPNLKMVNAAIAHGDSSVKLYRIAQDFEDTYRVLYKPTANPSGITSMDFYHVKSFLLKILPEYFRDKNVEDYIEQIIVPAININTLLKENNVNCIDFVQIDTEGFDAKIINMILDSNLRQLPRIMNFESKNLDSEEKIKLFNRLADHEYQLFHARGDTCAIKHNKSI